MHKVCNMQEEISCKLRVTATLEEKQGKAILRLAKTNHASAASAVRTAIDAGLRQLDKEYAITVA